MREAGENHLKAWSRDYNETPFYFVQTLNDEQKRLIAWTEDSTQSKRTFYQLLETFSAQVRVLLKICIERTAEGKNLWARYWALVDRWKLVKTIQANEVYIFSDGMHQLCIKEDQSERNFAFDEHGIFFIYDFTDADVGLLASLGFENREAPPLFASPHFQHTPPDPEILEAKFVHDLELKPVKSDLNPE